MVASEILAIPELFEKHLFSLIDLSDLQVAEVQPSILSLFGTSHSYC